MSERQDKEIPTRTDSQSQTTPPESPPAAPLAEEQEMPSTGTGTGTGSGSGGSASTGALATNQAQQGTDDTDQGVIERDDRESPAGDRWVQSQPTHTSVGVSMCAIYTIYNIYLYRCSWCIQIHLPACPVVLVLVNIH